MENRKFKISSKYSPSGDQPKAIDQLVNGINKGYDAQTLLGITGSGKNIYNCKCYRKSSKTYPYYCAQQNSCGTAFITNLKSFSR